MTALICSLLITSAIIYHVCSCIATVSPEVTTISSSINTGARSAGSGDPSSGVATGSNSDDGTPPIGLTGRMAAPPGDVPTTVGAGPVQQSTVTQTDCNAWCPTVYRDNCNGIVKMICASAAQANAAVVTTGNDCRQTWTCPPGTDHFFYTYGAATILPYTAGDYARCFPPPNNLWYLPDGTTLITGVSCESLT